MVWRVIGRRISVCWNSFSRRNLVDTCNLANLSQVLTLFVLVEHKVDGSRDMTRLFAILTCCVFRLSLACAAFKAIATDDLYGLGFRCCVEVASQNKWTVDSLQLLYKVLSLLKSHCFKRAFGFKMGSHYGEFGPNCLFTQNLPPVVLALLLSWAWIHISLSKLFDWLKAIGVIE